MKIKIILAIILFIPLVAMEKENNLIKPNIGTGNWRAYLQEIECNKKSKKIVTEFMKKILEERNARFTTSFLHLLPSQLNGEISKYDLNSEAARFIQILDNLAPKVVKYITNNIGDKQYNQLDEEEKLKILKYINKKNIRGHHAWYYNTPEHKMLRKILKLKSFESIAISEAAHKALLDQLGQVESDNLQHNRTNFSLFLHTPASSNYLKKLIEANDEEKKKAHERFCNYCTPSDLYIKEIDILIKIGVNVDYESDFDNSTALHYAKSLDVIKLLIENGASINKKVNKQTVLTRLRQEKELKEKDNPYWPHSYITFEVATESNQQDIAKIEEIINYLIINGATE